MASHVYRSQPCGLPKLKFTPEEDYRLVELKENQGLTWRQIAEYFPGRTSGTLQVRYSTKLKAKRSVWNSELDARLQSLVCEFQQGLWVFVASELGQGLSPEQCLSRYKDIRASDSSSSMTSFALGYEDQDLVSEQDLDAVGEDDLQVIQEDGIVDHSLSLNDANGSNLDMAKNSNLRTIDYVGGFWGPSQGQGNPQESLSQVGSVEEDVETDPQALGVSMEGLWNIKAMGKGTKAKSGKDNKEGKSESRKIPKRSKEDKTSENSMNDTESRMAKHQPKQARNERQPTTPKPSKTSASTTPSPARLDFSMHRNFSTGQTKLRQEHPNHIQQQTVQCPNNMYSTQFPHLIATNNNLTMEHFPGNPGPHFVYFPQDQLQPYTLRYDQPYAHRLPTHIPQDQPQSGLFYHPMTGTLQPFGQPNTMSYHPTAKRHPQPTTIPWPTENPIPSTALPPSSSTSSANNTTSVTTPLVDRDGDYDTEANELLLDL